MNRVIDIDTDKTTLIELVTGLKPDDEVVIVKDHKPVAKLVATSAVPQPRVPGLMKGKLTILAEDDEHLADFKEYMP
jgi:antitoxin (DNA-binding transcriptional repressor) of toxin-antitoxin stability system